MTWSLKRLSLFRRRQWTVWPSAILVFCALGTAVPGGSHLIDLRSVQSAKGARDASQESQATPVNPLFAYTNRSGDAVLAHALRDEEQASNFDRAICGDGRIVEVKFVRFQPAGQRSTGRDSSSNFEQDEGMRFA